MGHTARNAMHHSPQKHNQKFVKGLRKKLIVGSININGLDLEATWVVEQILAKHELDVSLHNYNTYNHLILYCQAQPKLQLQLG